MAILIKLRIWFRFFFTLLWNLISYVPILLFLTIVSYLAKYKKNKKFDIGLGPEPLINNIYHKKALELNGYKAETFVRGVFFITSEFDILAHEKLKGLAYKLFVDYYLYVLSIFRYKAVYMYFNGGPLSSTRFKNMEPFLYRIARVKIVILPYGSDVQEMTRSKNLIFKHRMAIDYPHHKNLRKIIERQIQLWTINADHIIGGCEWVDYMFHWDTLMLAHFSIDTQKWLPLKEERKENSTTLKILHAPNHKNIKGTGHFTDAVNELKAEGLDIELVLMQKVPNSEIRKVINSVDIVADQLIVGWYAMFALEGMASGKPVLCYLRDDLIDLYTEAGLITPNEIPIVNCNFKTVKEKIKYYYHHREELKEIGQKSRDYVIKHHSVESVGKVFKKINGALGI